MADFVVRSFVSIEEFFSAIKGLSVDLSLVPSSFVTGIFKKHSIDGKVCVRERYDNLITELQQCSGALHTLDWDFDILSCDGDSISLPQALFLFRSCPEFLACFTLQCWERFASRYVDAPCSTITKRDVAAFVVQELLEYNHRGGSHPTMTDDEYKRISQSLEESYKKKIKSIASSHPLLRVSRDAEDNMENSELAKMTRMRFEREQFFSDLLHCLFEEVPSCVSIEISDLLQCLFLTKRMDHISQSKRPMSPHWSAASHETLLRLMTPTSNSADDNTLLKSSSQSLKPLPSFMLWHPFYARASLDLAYLCLSRQISRTSLLKSVLACPPLSSHEERVSLIAKRAQNLLSRSDHIKVNTLSAAELDSYETEVNLQCAGKILAHDATFLSSLGVDPLLGDMANEFSSSQSRYDTLISSFFESVDMCEGLIFPCESFSALHSTEVMANELQSGAVKISLALFIECITTLERNNIISESKRAAILERVSSCPQDQLISCEESSVSFFSQYIAAMQYFERLSSSSEVQSQANSLFTGILETIQKNREAYDHICTSTWSLPHENSALNDSSSEITSRALQSFLSGSNNPGSLDHRGPYDHSPHEYDMLRLIQDGGSQVFAHENAKQSLHNALDRIVSLFAPQEVQSQLDALVHHLVASLPPRISFSSPPKVPDEGSLPDESLSRQPTMTIHEEHREAVGQQDPTPNDRSGDDSLLHSSPPSPQLSDGSDMEGSPQSSPRSRRRPVSPMHVKRTKSDERLVETLIRQKTVVEEKDNEQRTKQRLAINDRLKAKKARAEDRQGDESQAQAIVTHFEREKTKIDEKLSEKKQAVSKNVKSRIQDKKITLERKAATGKKK